MRTEAQKAAGKKHSQTPKGKYSQQKAHAKARGIPFHLTFEQWWALWEGKFHLRGKGPDDLCMCRQGDAGAYEEGNVFIGKVSENLIDQMKNGKHAAHVVAVKDLVRIAVLAADGIPQSQIARDIGITQPQVSKLLAGKRGKYIKE